MGYFFNDKIGVYNEFPMVLERCVSQSTKIGEYSMQFAGEILEIKAEKDIIGNDGLPDIGKIKPFVYDQVSKSYYSMGEFLAKTFSFGKKA